MRTRKQTWLFTKISLLIALFITLICICSVGIVYFWSYYYYGKIFEDRVIDEYTYKKNHELGVYNEWILGVTAHSIDVVEAIHGKETADHLFQNALNQKEDTHLYREKVNDKYLLYQIDLDYENGEKVYKYSVLKDIYKEIFPEMLLCFFLLSILIFKFSLLLTKIISNKLYSNISKLREYVNQTTYNDLDSVVLLDTEDEEIKALANSFCDMKANLKEKETIQQSMLQYISHELKTPIMIINSYAESAKDQIYPKGSLNDTLETITIQTKRMQNKVEDLLLIAKVNADYGNDQIQLVHVDELVKSVVDNMKYRDLTKPIQLNLENNMNIVGYKDKLQILFENLIDNQLKYSHTKMEIRGFMKNKEVVIFFYNDGEKIDGNTKKFLFKPFVKGDHGDHGLGLSICKSITNLHKGDISIVEVEHGTMFKVIINNLNDSGAKII